MSQSINLYDGSGVSIFVFVAALRATQCCHRDSVALAGCMLHQQAIAYHICATSSHALTFSLFALVKICALSLSLSLWTFLLALPAGNRAAALFWP